jgi:hypothetical protein
MLKTLRLLPLEFGLIFLGSVFEMPLKTIIQKAELCLNLREPCTKYFSKIQHGQKSRT